MARKLEALLSYVQWPEGRAEAAGAAEFGAAKKGWRSEGDPLNHENLAA